MSDCYLGEIRMFAGNYAPSGWALCNGQLLSISEYNALFALLGNRYGGDGETTFALPDLRGRIPIHTSQNYLLGASGGTEEVTLTARQLPAHTHQPTIVTQAGNVASPTNAFWATTTASNYSELDTDKIVSMNTSLISSQGGGQSHENMMPSLTISFIIALFGVFPSQQ